MTSLSNIDLKRLINASKNDYVDNTNAIRQIKHSQIIANDVNVILSTIMAADAHNSQLGTLSADSPVHEYLTDELIMERCAIACPTLYNGYNDIFMRLMKKEVNVGILFQVLNVLRDIEDGEVDHETGSIKVGKLLYNMYVDSRIRETEKLESTSNTSTIVDKDDELRQNMSWHQYKLLQKKQ